MYKIIGFCCLLIGLNACKSDNQHHHQHAQPTDTQPADTAKGSPARMAMANIGNAHIHINYNAPAVRKRIIWGGLVPFGDVWVTGAHQATNIEFSEDLLIAGQRVPKGKYGFFTIPGQQTWTLILNKNWDQHLTDEYTANEDLFRWQVTPDSSAHTERLTYTIVAQGDSGIVRFNWEKLSFAFDVKTAP